MMEHEIKIQVKFLDEASAYLGTLPPPVLKKMTHNITRVAGGEINAELFKKLNQDIWEFRVKMLGIAYRLLAFWDKETKSLIVAITASIKRHRRPHRAK